MSHPRSESLRRWVAASLLLIAELSFPTITQAGTPAGELARWKSVFSALEALRTDSLAPRLAAWVPAGEELSVWVLDSQRRCETAVLRRSLAPSGTRPTRALGERPQLLLGRCEPLDPGPDGAARRRCVQATVGHSWRVTDGEVHETRFHGVWMATGGFGFGDPVQSYGVLSEVTADAARFRGREARIAVLCRRHACGGSSAVDACETCIFPVVEDVQGVYGHGSLAVGRPPPPAIEEAGSPPPSRAQRAAFERINALQPWRVVRGEEPFAGIYRTSAACQRDAARFSSPPYPHDAE
jgi:hypothetical protein